MQIQKRFLVLAGLFLLVSCQSAPPPAPTPVEAPAPVVASVPDPVPEAAPAPVVEKAPDTIQVSRDGFSPLASPPNHTLVASIQWSDPTTLVEWAVEFVSEGSEPARTLRGTQALPTVDWDGKTDAGTLAPQGRYVALLKTAGSDGVLVERARSMTFVLDIVPPSGSMTVDPIPFSLGPATSIVDSASLVTIKLNITSGGAAWTTWRLGVFHPDGRRFRDFISEDHRDDQVIWDGRALNNAQLEAGTTYRLEAEIFDVYGNRGTIGAELPVAAPPPPPAAPDPKPITVTVTIDGEVLASWPVFFAPYSADLSLVEGEQRASNDQSLTQLAELLRKAEQTDIKVVGHANQVLYQDPIKAEYEQRETLIPLSLARAEAVTAALISEGVVTQNFETVGVGAANPVAPFSDAENRWKNRRVVLELSMGD